MFALFHLIFVLIKISVQSTVYATVVFIVVYILSKMTKVILFKNWMANKVKTWLLLGLIISIGLFFFSLSYWGNHGLGDSSRIPVGYGQAINNADGVSTYFSLKQDKPFQQEHITEFEIENDILYAAQEGNTYLIFDFTTSKVTRFQSKSDYNNFALKNKLPTTGAFRGFISHYHDYWSGWRFYLLP